MLLESATSTFPPPPNCSVLLEIKLMSHLNILRWWWVIQWQSKSIVKGVGGLEDKKKLNAGYPKNNKSRRNLENWAKWITEFFKTLGIQDQNSSEHLPLLLNFLGNKQYLTIYWCTALYLLPEAGRVDTRQKLYSSKTRTTSTLSLCVFLT